MDQGQSHRQLELKDGCCTCTHIAGKGNYADALSRLPVEEAQVEDSKETEEYAWSTIVYATPAALTTRKVEEASGVDKTLEKVHQAIVTGNWT